MPHRACHLRSVTSIVELELSVSLPSVVVVVVVATAISRGFARAPRFLGAKPSASALGCEHFAEGHKS
jgi:hypothetical protein